MKKKIALTLAVCTVGIATIFASSAYATGRYSVEIKKEDLACGEQMYQFKGKAFYPPHYNGHRLVLNLDGNIIGDLSPNPPTDWQTPAQLLTVGNHVFVAGVGPVQGPKSAEDGWKFTIEECEPEPTPEPTPTPEPGRETSFSLSGPTCTSNQIHADVSIKDNDNPVKGVNVEFTYKGETKWVETNTDGKAGASFEFRGEDKVKANPGGEGTAKPTDEECEPGIGGGQVLGASTQSGQVLGATTLADTGTVSEDMFGLLFTLGAGLMSVGIAYVTKQT